MYAEEGTLGATEEEASQYWGFMQIFRATTYDFIIHHSHLNTGEQRATFGVVASTCILKTLCGNSSLFLAQPSGPTSSIS